MRTLSSKTHLEMGDKRNQELADFGHDDGSRRNIPCLLSPRLSCVSHDKRQRRILYNKRYQRNCLLGVKT